MGGAGGAGGGGGAGGATVLGAAGVAATLAGFFFGPPKSRSSKNLSLGFFWLSDLYRSYLSEVRYFRY